MFSPFHERHRYSLGLQQSQSARRNDIRTCGVLDRILAIELADKLLPVVWSPVARCEELFRCDQFLRQLPSSVIGCRRVD
jgi:hypothetical protein